MCQAGFHRQDHTYTAEYEILRSRPLPDFHPQGQRSDQSNPCPPLLEHREQPGTDSGHPQRMKEGWNQHAVDPAVQA